MRTEKVYEQIPQTSSRHSDEVLQNPDIDTISINNNVKQPNSLQRDDIGSIFGHLYPTIYRHSILTLCKVIKIQRHDINQTSFRENARDVNKSKVSQFNLLFAILQNVLKETSMENCSALLKEPLVFIWFP